MFIHVPRVVVFPVHTLIIGLLVSPANTPTGVLKPPAGLMDSLAVKFKFMKNQNPNWRYFIVAGAVLAALGIWPLLAGKIQISLVAEVVALACVLTGLAIHFANCRRGKNRQPTHPTEASFKLSALLALLLGVQAGAHAQGTAFTYQGRLNFNGSLAAGNYDFRFRLATDALGNNFTGSPFLTNAVPVTNGLFFTTLDFGAGIFTGGNLWLQIEVKTNGAAGYSLLNPLQAFAPTPYAMFANTASNVSGTISAAQISGTIGNSVLPASPNFSGTITANAIAGNGANVTNVNAATLNGLNATNFWKLGGNSVSAGQFLGSTNNQPVEIWVNNQRALRLEPNNASPNAIGGFAGNFVAPGVWGATISGGGKLANGYTNKVTDDLGAIGGGQGNSVGAAVATIAGGGGNTIEVNANGAAIGGGAGNLIQGSLVQLGTECATIGGGVNNTIYSNAASATIPGGFENVAGGMYAFAAGQQAQALHQGAFVWADSQNAPFASTANDEFLIRAQGGVGIGTNDPAAQLHVSSSSTLPQLQLDQRLNDYSRLRFQTYNLPYWDIAVGANVMNFFASGRGNLMTLATNGNLTVAGTVTAHGVLLTSDRNAKENFTPLNPKAVLAKVAALPVMEWNYKSDDQTEKHIGPMAQDFQAAFQLSADDKHISVVDEGGVALAAIQGLNEKLETENANLKSQLAELKSLVEQLAQARQK